MAPFTYFSPISKRVISKVETERKGEKMKKETEKCGPSNTKINSNSPQGLSSLWTRISRSVVPILVAVVALVITRIFHFTEVFSSES
jgi:hypothetical protein